MQSKGFIDMGIAENKNIENDMAIKKLKRKLIRKPAKYGKAMVISIIATLLLTSIDANACAQWMGCRFKHGIVAAKGIVRTPGGDPIFAEYDTSGDLVSEIGAATGYLKDAEVVSALAYQGYIDSFNQVEEQHSRYRQILTRDQYLGKSFTRLDGSVFVGSEYDILPSTKSVVVLNEDRILDGSINHILFQAPINLNSLATLDENDRSLLINEDGNVIQKSEHNIGYRMAFATEGVSHDSGGAEVGTAGDDEISSVYQRTYYGRSTFQDKKFWNTIAGARIEHGLGGRAFTDFDGTYSIRYKIPACPCFFYTHNGNMTAAVNYMGFNPRGASPRTYYKMKPVYDSCTGYSQCFIGASLLGQMMRVNLIAIEATMTRPMYPLNFGIDTAMLSGTGFMMNYPRRGVGMDLDLVKVGLSGSTEYAYTAAGNRAKVPKALDLNGDMVPDNLVCRPDGTIGVYFDSLPDDMQAAMPGTICEVLSGEAAEDKSCRKYTDTVRSLIARSYLKVCEDGASACLTASGLAITGIGTDVQLNATKTIYVDDQKKSYTYDPKTCSVGADLIRMADYDPDITDQGLLKSISNSDIENTDIFVYRVSKDQLITAREGLGYDEYIPYEFGKVDTTDTAVNFNMMMRGHHFYDTLAKGLDQWQVKTGVNPELHGRNADHLRPGEKVKVIMINRATGYIGTAIGTYDTALGTNVTTSLNILIPPVVMRPPNLKITAERKYKIEHGLTKDEEREYLIGFEGSGMVSDQVIAITTEWYDHDGSPLPPDLPGYTGRLAKVVSQGTLGNSQIANFEIKPGTQLQLVQLPQKPDVAHYYLHVNGEAKENQADFSANGAAGTGLLKHRPDHYVPIQVAVYDDVATRRLKKELEEQQLLAAQAAQAEGQEWVEEDIEFDPVMRWVYRPEMQFSLMDLQFKNLTKSNKYNHTVNLTEYNRNIFPIAPDDRSVDLYAALLDSGVLNDLEMLDSFGPDRQLILAIGDHEVEVELAQNGHVKLNNLANVSELETEDFLTIKLYQNGDEHNVLWEYAAKKKIIVSHEVNEIVNPEPVAGVPPIEREESDLLEHKNGETIEVRREIDLPNQLVCNTKGSLEYKVSQDSTVNIKLYHIEMGQLLEDNPIELVTDQEKQANVMYSELIYPDMFNGAGHGQGQYIYEITAKSKKDGTTEKERGKLSFGYKINNTLPVGTPVVKGVNLFSGALSASHQDIALAGRGPKLNFSRHYSSSSSTFSSLGKGWSHNNLTGLSINNCNWITVNAGDGGSVRFIPDGEGGFTTTRGYHASLVYNHDNQSYDFYSKDGTKYHFERLNKGPKFKLMSVEDTNGNTLVYEYGIPEVSDPVIISQPYLLSVTDEAGRKLEYTYDVKTVTSSLIFTGRDNQKLKSIAILLTSVTGPDGMQVDFDYNDEGLLTNVNRDGDARVDQYEYYTDLFEFDKHHLLKKYINPNGYEDNYSYIDKPLKVGEFAPKISFTEKVTQADLGTTSFIYDFEKLETREEPIPVTVNNGRGVNNQYTLNAYGAPLTFSNPAGVVETTWSDDMQMLSRTNRRGVTTNFSYDEHGNVLTEATAGFNPIINTYHLLGDGKIKNRIASKTDRNGNTTTFDYDDGGNLVEITDAMGGITTLEYNDNGDLITKTNQEGEITSFTYDSYGHTETTTYPNGGVLDESWNAKSEKLQTTTVLGAVIDYSYDALGYLTQASNSVTGTKTFGFDPLGNKLLEENENGVATSYQYDGASRLVKINHPMGYVQRFGYDENGNKTLETDVNGNETTYNYDGADRLTKATMPEGRFIDYGSDEEGNVTSETNAKEQVTQYAYDNLNRRTKITDAMSGVTQIILDGEGNTLGIVDQEGNSTTFEYDKLNRKIKITDAMGNETTMGYDKVGRLIRTTDARGIIRTTGYDIPGRTITDTDGLGFTVVQNLDAAGNQLGVIDKRGKTLTNTYDPMGRKTSTVDREGNVFEYTYDGVDNLTKEKWPNGNENIYSYDDLNRRIGHEDTLGPVVATGYDGNGNKISVTDAMGNAASFTYNAFNQITLESLPEGRGDSFEYDTVGNLVLKTDSKDNKTSYDYDDLNRLITETDPASFTVAIQYDKVGNKTQVTDKVEGITAYRYNQIYQLEEEEDHYGNKIITSYDPVGNILQQTNKRSIVSEFGYDAENRLLTSVTAGVTTETNTYDPNGNKLSIADGESFTIEYTYDNNNRVTSQIDATLGINIAQYEYTAMGDQKAIYDGENRKTENIFDARRRLTSSTFAGNTNNYGYDLNNNKILWTKPGGNSFGYSYDGANRLTSVIDPAGNGTVYNYDTNDNLTSQQDANGYVVAFDYDARDLRTSINYADGNSYLFSDHDGNGNAQTITDPKGQSIALGFDKLSRETSRSYTGDSSGLSDVPNGITTDYDANSNPTSISLTYSGGVGTLTTTNSFDSFDRLTSVNDGYNRAIEYGYYNNGNRKSVSVGSRALTYQYENASRLKSAIAQVEGIGSRSTSFSYDNSGLITTIEYPNNSQIEYIYEATKRVDKILHTQNSSPVSSFDYSYDSNGNRLQQIETNGGAAQTTSYVYNNLDQLTSVTYPDSNTYTYTYDANYNRASEVVVNGLGTKTVDKTYAYNTRNQLKTITDNLDAGQNVTYTYDDNGNQVQKVKGTDTTSFTYDIRDHLRVVSHNDQERGQYLFDHQGMRISKTEAGKQTKYVYDGKSVLQQYENVADVISHYYYGNSQLMQLHNTTEGLQYYHLDALGSVVNLTKDDGQVQARYSYDAFGHTRQQTGTSANSFGFTGHEKDDATGLYYFKARFYDPDTGRFLSQDSYEGTTDTPPSLHKYLYAYSNPLVYVDPDGYMSYDEYEQKAEEFGGNTTPEFYDWVESRGHNLESFMLMQSMIETEDEWDSKAAWSSIGQYWNKGGKLWPKSDAVEGYVRAYQRRNEYERDNKEWSREAKRNSFNNMEYYTTNSYRSGALGMGHGAQLFADAASEITGAAVVTQGAKLGVKLVPKLIDKIPQGVKNWFIKAVSKTKSFKDKTKELLNTEVIASRSGTGKLGKTEVGAVGDINYKAQRGQGSSLWTDGTPGIQTRKFGNYWVKRVNPNANRFMQWWGKQTIKSQHKQLKKLKDLATPSEMRNGKLFTRDVGETFSGGRFSLQRFHPTVMKNYIKGSWRMKVPMNDLIPRNMGKNGKIFDPAIDWFSQTLAIGTGASLYGGYKIYEHYSEPD